MSKIKPIIIELPKVETKGRPLLELSNFNLSAIAWVITIFIILVRRVLNNNLLFDKVTKTLQYNSEIKSICIQLLALTRADRVLVAEFIKFEYTSGKESISFSITNEACLPGVLRIASKFQHVSISLLGEELYMMLPKLNNILLIDRDTVKHDKCRMHLYSINVKHSATALLGEKLITGGYKLYGILAIHYAHQCEDPSVFEDKNLQVLLDRLIYLISKKRL